MKIEKRITTKRSYRKFAITCFAFAILFNLPGCQTELPQQKSPKVTIEQAKQLTVAFKAQTEFALPERSIDGFLAELDSLTDNSEKILHDLILRADTPIPQDGSQNKRWEVYRDRAEAARMIGRYGQAMEDAGEALELATGPEQRRGPLHTLGGIHEEIGSYHEAQIAFEKRPLRHRQPDQKVV